MALVTAQQRQTLRLPTPDLSVDSIDQLALLGIWQVESTQATISANQKRWILRLPVIDAAVDELDAWGFLQLPASGGGGNQTEVFSLNWVIDPTWTTSEPSAAIDGAFVKTLGGFIAGFIGDGDSGGRSSVNTIYGEGRSKRKGVRLSVNINGENVPVNTVEEAQALLKAQAHPKERIKRRKRPKVRIIERLRPDIPVSEQVEALGQNIGEIADAAVRNADVVRLFNDAVAQQSIAALGALRMGIENAQEAPEPLIVPPEVQITPEEQELADGLMRQVGVFDEVLGIFLKGISEMEREAYREMDAIMERQRPRYDALSKDRFNEAMRLWAEEVNKRNADRYNERVAKKRKRFDAFKKVFK